MVGCYKGAACCRDLTQVLIPLLECPNICPGQPMLCQAGLVDVLPDRRQLGPMSTSGQTLSEVGLCALITVCSVCWNSAELR